MAVYLKGKKREWIAGAKGCDEKRMAAALQRST
jgi:hypothetical protein